MTVKQTEAVKKLAEKLRQRREELGLTKTQLAGEVGVTRDTVRRWELGLIAPAADTLLRWQMALGERTELVHREEVLGDDPFDHPDWRKMRSTLHQMRLRARMTQADVAEEVGVAVNTLSNWETGKRTPGVMHLIAWAAVFGLGVEIPTYGTLRRR